MQIKLGNVSNSSKLLAVNQKKAGTVTNKAYVSKEKSDAATLSLSQQGKLKSLNSKKSTKEEIMQEAENRINNIIDTMKADGTLSKEDKELVENELRGLSMERYADGKAYKMSKDELLAALKDNYMHRQELYAQMQEKIQAEQESERDGAEQVKLIKALQENEADEELIKLWDLIMEDDEEDETTEEPVTEDSEMNSEEEQPEIHLDVESESEKSAEEVPPLGSKESEALTSKKRAAKLIEKTGQLIEEAKGRCDKAASLEKERDTKINESYGRLMKAIDSDEISLEDKAKEYYSFKENVEALAKDREIQKAVKEYERGTWILGKIMANGFNDLYEVMEGKAGKGALKTISTEFAKIFFLDENQ